MGEARIGRIIGVIGEGGVVIIDLEKDRVTVGLEAAEIVLAVGIVLVTKIVINRNGLDDSRDGFIAECSDAGCHDSRADAGAEVLA